MGELRSPSLAQSSRLTARGRKIMGEFVVEERDLRTGQPVGRCALANWLAYEGLDTLYHRIFPTLVGAPTYVIGVSGCSLRDEDDRPNPLPSGEVLGPLTTWSGATSVLCEGGCYSSLMRDLLDYDRQAVTIYDQANAEGGEYYSTIVEFGNQLDWSPDDCDKWDDPTTTDRIELCPREYAGCETWEPARGWPWHSPRKLGLDLGELGNCSPSYIKRILGQTGCNGTPSDLDWLNDVRLSGGFPLTCVFMGDSSRNELVAMAKFRSPVLLHPGVTLHVRYRARIVGVLGKHDCDGVITAAFAQRFAARIAGGGSAYDGGIFARPVLADAPLPARTLTYNDLTEYFDPEMDAVELSSWTYVGYPTATYPYVRSATAPTWTNNSSPPRTIGPLSGLAVYGIAGGVPELMWLKPFAEPASVPYGDTLRVPDYVTFCLRGT